MLKLSFRNQVLTGFAISIILVLVVGVLSIKSINQLESDTLLVEHSQQVIYKSGDLLQLMIDAETGMRGFVATDKRIFLDPYNAALPNIANDVNDLNTLTIDEPEQLKRVQRLSDLVSLQKGILRDNIQIRDIKGLDYMVQNNMLLSGKDNMDEIRTIKVALVKAEDVLLKARKESSAKASNQTEVIIISGSVIFLLIIIMLFYYIQRTFEEQKKIEEEIRVTNIELEKVLAENEAKNWLLTGTGILNEKMQGQQSEKELAGNILNEVINYTKAFSGTLYLHNEAEERLELYASYAFHDLSALKNTVKLTEGWLGQAAQNKKVVIVKGKLNDKLNLESSIVYEDLVESIIVPFTFDKRLIGAMELAFKGELDKNIQGYITEIGNDIGIAINTAQARTIMHDLFEETQQQAEE